MAQVIKNPFFKEQEEIFRQQPSRATSCCLKLREPVRQFCYIGTFLTALSIVFVVYGKTTLQCPAWSPYPLCLANRYCAYIEKRELNSYMDLLPFIQEGGRCIERSTYNDIVYNGVEGAVDLINWFSDKIVGGPTKETDKDQTLLGKTKELLGAATTSKKSKKQTLLSDFKYYYDEEIFMRLTRFEFGLWLLFAMLFFMRKAMDTCGRKKTVFDFMRPSTLEELRKQSAGISQEDIRKAREEALRKKKR